MKNANMIIGIDPGTQTGLAVYNRIAGRLVMVDTLRIHRAMSQVLGLKYADGSNVFVRVEDARLRTWFGQSGREKLQGAGSVKRDSRIWEDFLTDEEIPFELVAPKNNVTKISAKGVQSIDGIYRKSERTRKRCEYAGLGILNELKITN